MTNMKTILVRAICASAVLLQACGGGGESSGSAAPAGGTPPVSTESGAADPAQPSSQMPTFVAQSALGKLLQDGLYAVSYGMGSINSKDDKSIWRTTLRTWLDGSHEPVSTTYAGNDQRGNEVLAESLWPVYEPDGNNRSRVLYNRLDDANGKILVGDGTSPFAARYIWNVEIDTVELAQTSFQQFMSETSSLTKPISTLTLDGSFPSESRGYRLRYSADVDRVFFRRDEVFIRTQAEFERSYFCGNVTADARVAYRILPGGSMEIYAIDADTSCIPAVEAGKLIGVGTWVRKTGDGFDYIEKNFPPDISYARFDPKFSAAAYAAGVREVELISPRGIWSSGYLVPAGVKFQAANLALNKTAADAFKAAAPM